MTSFDQPWRPQLDWSAPAGRVLDQLVEALPASRTWEITVFGFSPLQLGAGSRFRSGDAEVIPNENITGHCERAGWLKGMVANQGNGNEVRP